MKKKIAGRQRLFHVESSYASRKILQRGGHVALHVTRDGVFLEGGWFKKSSQLKGQHHKILLQTIHKQKKNMLAVEFQRGYLIFPPQGMKILWVLFL